MESIRKYFQIGIVHFMAYPSTMKGDCDLDAIQKTCRDDYFDAIEITHINDNQVRKQAKTLLEQSHMKICYGAQPRLLTAGLNPNHLEEAERVKAEKVLIDSIDEAHYMGCKAIAFLAGKYSPETMEKSYEMLQKTTKNLCDYAADKDMSIILEVFDFDLDKKSLIGPASYALQFAADMRKTTSNFGLMVDLSHIPQTKETSRFVLRLLKPYVVHLHIGNGVLTEGAEAFGDTHPRFGFPSGCNDTPEVLEFLRVLKEEGYFDSANPMVLSFEVKPWASEDPDIIIANAKRVLNRAWAML